MDGRGRRYEGRREVRENTGLSGRSQTTRGVRSSSCLLDTGPFYRVPVSGTGDSGPLFVPGDRGH